MNNNNNKKKNNYDEELNFNSVIFTKKLNNKYKVIPLKIINNTLGPTKYFPATIKEWSSSVYSFNKNLVKLLSIKGKNLNKIIQGYFNFYFNKNILNTKAISTRFKRLSTNKIFVSKAELKHTSSKVVISLYIYNEEKRILIRKIKRLESLLFPSHGLLSNKSNDNKFVSLQNKLKIINNKTHNIYLTELLSKVQSIFNKKLLLKKDFYLNSLKTEKLGSPLWKEANRIIEEIEITLNNVKDIDNYCETNSVVSNHLEKYLLEFSRKKYLDREIMTIAYYNLLLNLNKYKFENKSLLKMKSIIGKIYKKEVEFNIVNLKTLYLSSDIFTQAISIKLKNRNNKLLDILRYSLHMIKLPRVNRVREKYSNLDIKNLWVNKIKGINMWVAKDSKDTLNELLFDLYSKYSFVNLKNLDKSNIVSSSSNDNLSTEYKFIEEKESKTSLINLLFKDLKNKQMAGARLEAKGRLTRRFTASRSVFKIKWKGTLKNIDSSYRGLSTIMLRGHVKSNVQYSIINSKNRNGAYGVKGWISSK